MLRRAASWVSILPFQSFALIVVTMTDQWLEGNGLESTELQYILSTLQDAGQETSQEVTDLRQSVPGAFRREGTQLLVVVRHIECVHLLAKKINQIGSCFGSCA